MTAVLRFFRVSIKVQRKELKGESVTGDDFKVLFFRFYLNRALWLSSRVLKGVWSVFPSIYVHQNLYVCVCVRVSGWFLIQRLVVNGCICSTSRLHSSPVVLIRPNTLRQECRGRTKGTSCKHPHLSHSCVANHASVLIDN